MKDVKKKYQKPTIEISEIVTTTILAASPNISGNTGIGTGEGEPPTTGNAKPWLWDDDYGSSGSFWDD